MGFLTLQNWKIRTKILLIPALTVACIIYLALLFSNVIVAQQKLLQTFSSTDFKKSEALVALYSNFSTTHIAIFNILAQAGVGGDEGALYEAGIARLDSLKVNLENARRFAEVYALNTQEHSIDHMLLQDLEKYHAASATAIEMATVDLTSANKSVLSANAYFMQVDKAFRNLLQAVQTSSTASFSQLQENTHKRFWLFISVAIGLSMLLLGISVTIARAITVPLRRMMAHVLTTMSNIATGNLTTAIDVTRRDEIGQLAQAVQDMQTKLQQLISALQSTSTVITTAAAEITQGRAELHQRTQEQAASLTETASSLAAMTSTVQSNAERTRQANQLATGAREQAEKGSAVAEKAVAAMEQINTSSK